MILSIGSFIGTYVSLQQRHALEQTETESGAIQPEKQGVAKEDAYNGSGVPDNISQEVLNTYLECLKPANDEYDYRFETDYEYYNLIQMTECHDSKGYEKAFGYVDVSLDDIKKALEDNDNISSKYKEFIYEYASKIREAYPTANLSVLFANLDTLIVDEISETEIAIWEPLQKKPLLLI